MFEKYTFAQFVEQSDKQIKSELMFCEHISERTATILHEGAEYYTGKKFDYFKPMDTLNAIKRMVV